MASEFNIKNGFISNSNSRVLGTLTATTLNLQFIGSGTSVNNLGVDIYGNVVSGVTTTGGVSGDYLPLSGGTIDTTIGVVISGNSSSDMLRITQIGSGNAILVEDSTNPDATPFVVNSDGKIGIGTTSPNYFMEAISSGGTDAIMLFDGGTSANANLVARANTTQKVPSIVLTDNNDPYSINDSFFIGLDRTSGVTSNLYVNRNDAIYVNNYQEKGHYFVTNDAGSKDVRMSISSNGNVGIGVMSATTKLEVSGDTLINGNLSATTISATTITATTFYGSGSGLTDIPIAGVSNLTTELSNKFDKTGGTVTGSVIITQNVTVLGTATTINTQTLSIADNVVTLNSNYSAGTPFFGHSGVEVLRGSGTTAAMLWEEQNSQWEAGLHGSTRKIILSGDSLSYLSSGHTHPISEITNLQTNLNDKLSKSTGGTVVAESYFQGGLTASTTSANQLVIPFASVAVYEDEPPSISSVGIAGFFDASTGVASSKYSLQLKDGTEGIDKVLVSKTTDGKANWSNNLNVNQLYANTISATTYQNLPIPYGLINAISSGNYLI